MNWFQQFYKSDGDKLYVYLLHKSGNHELAADLVQEAFARYWEHYRDHEASTALLFTIGRNLYYDHTRKARNNIQYEDNRTLQTQVGQEESFIAKEDAARMRDCLLKLNEKDRDLLTLVVSSGYSYQIIADICCCSRANVKMKIHRARKRLRKLMQERSHE